MPRRLPHWITGVTTAATISAAALGATGNLPGPAQGLLADGVSHVGVDLPDSADDHAQDHADDHGKGHDEASPAGHDDDEPKGEGHADGHDNHGATVSSFVHSTDLEGCEKGQAVAELASSKNQGDEDAPGLGDDHNPCDHDDGTTDVTTADGPGATHDDQSDHSGHGRGRAAGAPDDDDLDEPDVDDVDDVDDQDDQDDDDENDDPGGNRGPNS